MGEKSEEKCICVDHVWGSIDLNNRRLNSYAAISLAVKCNFIASDI
jgi:hypothetical protein